MAKKVEIVQQPEQEVPAQVIAAAILKIADGMKALESSRLKQKAIVALIHDQSGVAKRTIDIVINNLKDLANDWLK